MAESTPARAIVSASAASMVCGSGEPWWQVTHETATTGVWRTGSAVSTTPFRLSAMRIMKRAVCFVALSSSAGRSRSRGVAPAAPGTVSATWQYWQFTPSAVVKPRMMPSSESRGMSFG